MACHPWRPPFGPSLRDVKNRSRRFFMACLYGCCAAGRRCATLKIASDNFLWPAIPGGHPSGRRCATLKIAPGNFFGNLIARN